MGLARSHFREQILLLGVELGVGQDALVPQLVERLDLRRDTAAAAAAAAAVDDDLQAKTDRKTRLKNKPPKKNQKNWPESRGCSNGAPSKVEAWPQASMRHPTW